MAKNVPKRLHIWKSAKIDLDNVLTMNIWSRVSIYLIGFGSLNLVFIPKNSIFIKNTLLLKKKKLNTAEVKILNRNKADLNGTDSEEWNYKNIERLKTWHFLVFQLERKIRLVLIQKLIINLCQCEPLLDLMQTFSNFEHHKKDLKQNNNIKAG